MPGNGPPPKRTEERRRRNKTDASGRPYEETVEAVVIDQQAEILAEVVVPAPDPTWHPIARMLWDSILKSGQSMFYEPSDWAVAFLTCESISRDFLGLPEGLHGTPAERGRPAETAPRTVPAEPDRRRA